MSSHWFKELCRYMNSLRGAARKVDGYKIPRVPSGQNIYDRNLWPESESELYRPSDRPLSA
jgi:hypothetical protein